MYDIGQNKQAFIDEASLLIGLFIGQPLAACQIYQIEDSFWLSLHPLDLEDSVRSWGVVMVFFLAIRPLLFSKLQQIESLLIAVNLTLFGPVHFVIDNFEVDWPWTEQVVNLFIVYFQVGDAEMHIVPGEQLIADILEGVLDETTDMLIAQHGKCLAGRGLPVHEYGAIPAPVGELVDDLMAALVVYFFVGVSRPEGMVIHELVPVAPLDSRAECVFLLMLECLWWVVDIDIFSEQGGGVDGGCNFIGVMIDFPYFLVLE